MPGLQCLSVKRHSVFLIVFLCTVASAQTRKLSPKELPPSAFKLISIKITGSDRYSPEEISDATGLKIGSTFTNDDFKAATEKLGESGLFSDVAYSYSYASDGTRLTFQLSENEKLVPARFDNIVWYSDQELMTQVHERVPLFQGMLPIAGGLPDQVSDALQALMDKQNVSGRVDYLRWGRENGPIEAIVYSIHDADIRIRKTDFTGAPPEELTALESAAKKLTDTDYTRSVLGVEEAKTFLPIFQAKGYLKASFGEPQAKVVENTSNPTIVDVTLPVTPGPAYKVDGVQISGNAAFPADKLRPLIHLQPGQPANGVQLLDDLRAVQQLYGTKGYMAATVKPVPTLDDSQSTASYALEITEGGVFKMGELTIEGLDKETTARLEEDWKLGGGEPYDSSYARRFLQDSAEELKGMGAWNETIHETVDNDDKIVDVTIRYDPKPR